MRHYAEGLEIVVPLRLTEDLTPLADSIKAATNKLWRMPIIVATYEVLVPDATAAHPL